MVEKRTDLIVQTESFCSVCKTRYRDPDIHVQIKDRVMHFSYIVKCPNPICTSGGVTFSIHQTFLLGEIFAPIFPLSDYKEKPEEKKLPASIYLSEPKPRIPLNEKHGE